MSAFRDFLDGTYAADPAAVAEFASSALTFVRIRRRWWRGYRKAAEAEVAVGGEKVDKATTRPSWKLCPDQVLDEFRAFGDAVDRVIGQYCFVPGDDDETGAAVAAAAVLVGNGRYAVDSAVWPRLAGVLADVERKWGEAADRWTTEDGYARLHAALGEQLGAATYDLVKDLVPDRHALRARFGLDYRVAPVRIAPPTPGAAAAARASHRAELVDLLDLAVRAPREAAAGVWDGLAARLVAGDPPEPVRPTRPGADGQPVPTTRRISARTLLPARRATEDLGRAERYLDEPLRAVRDRVLAELPAAADALSAVAEILNTDDTAAARVGKLLLTAAAAARDEAGMCAGLGAALARSADPPGPPGTS